jgi:ABC-type nitrate/sulfonate/bicarbonate transport system substrate-binding protein
MKAVNLAVCLVLLLSFSVASAQLTKTTVGYGSISTNHFPAWMAKESGVFRGNGLDVELVYFRGGTTAMMALLSRETPISEIAGPSVVSASLRGTDVVMIAGGVVTSDQWLVTRPGIKAAEQLKGGSVATSVYGGSSDFLARMALKKIGLTPVKDVAIVQIGGVPERLGALEKGKVQAAMLGVTEALMAQKKGFNALAAATQVYQAAGVATTRRFIRESPDIVRRYIKSQIEAVHRIKTDRETAKKVLLKYLGPQDKDVLERRYDYASADERLPPKQYPTLEGIKNILESLAETDPKAKTAKPEDFVDVSFIKELEESGFIDDLYKGRKR